MRLGGGGMGREIRHVVFLSPESLLFEGGKTGGLNSTTLLSGEIVELDNRKIVDGGYKL